VGALYRSKNLSAARLETKTWLEFIGLVEKKDLYSESLTYSECKRLDIARALATRPQLLLLDEPLGGLNAREVLDFCDLIKEIHKSGVTIVIVEHVMKGVMSLSQRIVVINQGEKIAEGSPEQVVSNEDVIKAYLGSAYAAG